MKRKKFNSSEKIRKLTQLSVFLAMGIILNFVESLIPLPGVVPGNPSRIGQHDRPRSSLLLFAERIPRHRVSPRSDRRFIANRSLLGQFHALAFRLAGLFSDRATTLPLQTVFHFRSLLRLRGLSRRRSDHRRDLHLLFRRFVALSSDSDAFRRRHGCADRFGDFSGSDEIR